MRKVLYFRIVLCGAFSDQTTRFGMISAVALGSPHIAVRVGLAFTVVRVARLSINLIKKVRYVNLQDLYKIHF
jgi:hypothetical protein